MNSFCLLLVAVCLVSTLNIVYGEEYIYDYGMVIDAGSTGSRLYIYRWDNRESSTSSPPQSRPEQLSGRSQGGPVSSITSQKDSDDLISSLLEFPKTVLANDTDDWLSYPVYLKATAGMRVLDIAQRAMILTFIKNSFQNKAINPFYFDDTFAIITSGEEEATFGWLGVNSLFDILDDGDNNMTFGSLDLGGRSTQIAFAPNPSSNILDRFTAVNLYRLRTIHRLYTMSFLHYGNEAVAERIAQILYDEHMNDSNQSDVIYSPCLNEGANETVTVDLGNGETGPIRLVGNANDDLSKCLELTLSLLCLDTTCYVQNCAFNGQYLAEIPPNMTFIAYAAYAYPVSDLGLPSDVDLADLYQASQALCNMSYEELRDTDYFNEYTSGYCRLTTWIYTLLHYGYGFPLVNTPIIFTNDVNEKSVSWTQGSILRDANWLPYDLEQDDDELINDEESDSPETSQSAATNETESGQEMWQVVAIIFICLFAVSVILGALLLYKYHTLQKTYRGVPVTDINDTKGDGGDDTTRLVK